MYASEAATQLRLKNVLYATDLSFAAERALPYALEIARRYKAKIYALHVIRPDVYRQVPPEISPQLALDAEVFRQESKKDLEEQLRGVPYEIIFEPGNFWRTFSDLIHEKHIDLVVFSTHGRSGLQNLLVGSVAEEMLRRVPCPVLAVGPAVTVKPRQNAGLNRIVFATDFSTESLAAVPYAISLAQEHRAELILLHSLEDGGDVPAMLRALHQLVPFGADLRCAPNCVVVRGAPAAKILDVAEGHGADLIILGVRQKKEFMQQHLAGSGVYRIVTKATCPVMIVRS